MPAKVKKDFQTPGVVFQPAASRGMQRGINQIVNAIAPTLGPLPRFVAIERIAKRDSLPERLDSGGTIARRIIQVQDRNTDVGAMYIRNVLYTLQERIGDGAATAAVMFQAIYNEGLHYLVSGGNPLRLRVYMDDLVPLIHAELDRMTVRLSGKKQLSGLAATITHDPEMAPFLGEIFDIIGAYGRLELRIGRSRNIEREYVEGVYYDNGVISREMIFNQNEQKSVLEEAHILVSDLNIHNPEDLVPLLEMAIKHEIKSILMICTGISDRALGILLNKANQEKVKIVAVKTPGVTLSERIGALEDIAILTGAQVLTESAGDVIKAIRPEQLGHARRAWGGKEHFGLVGGKGDPRKLREHIAALRKGFTGIPDTEDRKQYLERIGKLMGGSATLWVGDTTANAIEMRKELASHAAEAMRRAIRDGVVPGGGVALYDCATAVRKASTDLADPDQIAAHRIMIKALELPMRTIVSNAGLDPDEIILAIKQAGPGYGCDVIRREVVDMAQAGIFDVASVVKEALHAAINGASLALTTDVIIHRKNPPESLAKTS